MLLKSNAEKVMGMSEVEETETRVVIVSSPPAVDINHIFC